MKGQNMALVMFLLTLFNIGMGVMNIYHTPQNTGLVIFNFCTAVICALACGARLGMYSEKHAPRI